MKAYQRIKKNKIGSMCPRIHGHTKIVFTDKFGRETVKLDKDNLVTDAIQKIFESNYFGSIDYSQLMPAIKKVVGGVVLFESALDTDASNIWIPNSFDNKIIGHAGQTVPASLADDITRGIPNTAASVALSNGYKLVWNFPETQGNGDISAVGLCHSDFGDYALKNEAFKPIEMISNDSVKSVTWARDDERYKILNVHDSVNGYSYTLVSDEISVSRNGQSLSGGNFINFKVKKRKNQLIRNISVDMNHFLGNEENEESFTLKWSESASGSVTNYALPSIYIDTTNNLFWVGFGYGNAYNGGNRSFDARAYDMTQFAEGASLDPVKTQTISGIVALGSNMPLQGIIKEGADGYIPAIFTNNTDYYFGLVSYDTNTKEFSRENVSKELCSFNLGQRFSEVIALGNYYLVRGNIESEFTKLFEVDRTNAQIEDYIVSPSGVPTISPYFIEPDNPIIGATQWAYSPVKFTMQNSGTALNKLYLATKNSLPSTITKTPADSMRVEYTLTYA